MHRIVPLFSDFTGPMSVQLGEICFRRSRVLQLEKSPNSITAEIDEGGSTRCSLERSGSSVRYECTCFFYEQHGRICKHLHAMLLAVDASGGADERWDFQDLLSKSGHDPIEELIRENEVTGLTRQDLERWRREPRVATSSFHRRPLPPPPPPWWQRLVEHPRAPDEKSETDDRDRFEPVFLLAIASGSGYAAGSVVSYRSLKVRFAVRIRKRDGKLGKPRQASREERQRCEAKDEGLASLCATLDGMKTDAPFTYAYRRDEIACSWDLNERNARHHIERLCASGRFFHEPEEWNPDFGLGPAISWNGAVPHQVVIELSRFVDGRLFVDVEFRRGAETIDSAEVFAITDDGLALVAGCFIRFEPRDIAAMARALHQREDLNDRIVATNEVRPFLKSLLSHPAAPIVEYPADLGPTQLDGVLEPELRIGAKTKEKDTTLTARVVAAYGARDAELLQGRRAFFDAEAWKLVRRDIESEQRRAAELRSLGLEISNGSVRFEEAQLPEVVTALTASGWIVRAESLRLRPPGELQLQVKSSGIDWFDLRGEIEFGGNSVALPRLLAEIERGRRTVELDDGTLGMIPERWLRVRRALLAHGKAEEGALRFRASQAALVTAILDNDEGAADNTNVSVDETFSAVREAIRKGSHPTAEEPAEGFKASLRPYQKEGLGFLRHLLRLHIGGCLADDMGLGKTVQVLALLYQRKASRPSLVVAPRSVAFNWLAEAERFAPELKIAAYFGSGREEAHERVKKGGVLVTTYGTLRSDEGLRKIPFDVVVLDEAQAIKNRSTATAVAARELKAQHRIALSGTPVENHFGEILSLFEFLNPGLFGATAKLRKSDEDEAGRALVTRALRPFLLRRTKEQVAPDLPSRTEQTVICEMEGEQRELYEELRDHIRQNIVARVEAVGMNAARLQVLEALLRLRQAACHPGLIDKKRSGQSSAKLDALLPRLVEVIAEGHKALVFSQFTSFLELLKPRLDDIGLKYEYLDGQTRDREACVRRFQEDPECPLFLISLRAGGLGLNLTAAEYVFLLDPWWNPAVEAQAVDRAHRIGQTKPVFAYRLLTKNTVEERVAELQAQKRALFDSLMADTATLRDLDLEDLRMLLS